MNSRRLWIRVGVLVVASVLFVIGARQGLDIFRRQAVPASYPS